MKVTYVFALSVFAIIAIMYLMQVNVIYAQTKLSDADAFIVMVNIERMRTQILLTEKSLAEGDNDIAFAHAYIPHAVTFPSIKNQLNKANPDYSSMLEGMLTDLPINIRTQNPLEKLKQDLSKIENLLNNISNHAVGSHLLSDKAMIAQTIIFLLRDAGQSYQLSNVPAIVQAQQQQQQDNKKFSKVDYENAGGLVNTSKANYQKVANSLYDERRSQEIESFFRQLENSIAQRSDQESVIRLIAAIQRDLAEGLSLSEVNQSPSEYAQYFSTVRTLLSEAVAEVKENGDYKKANQYAVKAYLDNYEYLEAPIEKYDPKLMADIEIQMREELRKMLKNKESPENIEAFVNTILGKLGEAEKILKSDSSFAQQEKDSSITTTTTSGSEFADIEILGKGFGVYTGERRQIGQAEDPAKTAVRKDIDQIRLNLDKMLNLYEKGNYQQALLTSRSAYLDSYENVEIPLRPIDPDFTLEMEIKFAELRNLIQKQASYEEVKAKTVEIRKGLDESERLVSGTGIIAPAIAFSTSFSIIFREGLESALIIGAILTYLEASRNEHFKKHVYYGIVLAIGGTALTWFIAEFIIKISGASREFIEAVAGVSAVAVLFWVSFWVLNKIETKKWIEFVKAKVWKAATTGSVMVFVMLSFFTVYREGFETVLFYQAILSFAKYMEWYVIVGMILGLAVIIGVALGVRKLGKKLPLRVLFGLTMGIGAYMSIAFIGNAIREFQEVGYISTTHLIGIIPRLDINLATMTGIHPTLETIVAQVVLLSVYVIGSLYILIMQPRKKKAIEASRKSMADLEKRRNFSPDKY